MCNVSRVAGKHAKERLETEDYYLGIAVGVAIAFLLLGIGILFIGAIR